MVVYLLVAKMGWTTESVKLSYALLGGFGAYLIRFLLVPPMGEVYGSESLEIDVLLAFWLVRCSETHFPAQARANN
jgi:hypothetical protein